MIKINTMMKKILFGCIITFALPKIVLAAPDLFIQSCLKTDGTACPVEENKFQVEAGETVKIVMSVETEKKINGFSATIALENMSNVSNFTYDEIWGTDSAINGNTFLVMRDPGNIPNTEDLRKEIGSFNVTAGTTLGDAKIIFEDIDATYLDGQTVEDYAPAFTGSLTLNVIETSNNQNTNENTTTNENTNTNTNSNTTSDTSKKEKNPSNPKTGVKISILGMAILVSACGISYVVLRKKNYFNKI